MRGVGLHKYLPIDNPESLLDIEIPKPELRPRDLVVQVKAVSVNPVDTKVRSPKDKIESAPRVLGWDAAGIVEGIGSGVTLFQPGDEVYYAGVITRPGCNSEYHAVDERSVGRKPRNLSFEDAAALPLTTITAWEALFDRLIANESKAKLIDLGYSLFEHFFDVCEQIEFVEAARRRGFEVIILFPAEPHPSATAAYENMQRRFPNAVLVPVLNEAILKGERVHETYRVDRESAAALKVPLMPPVLVAPLLVLGGDRRLVPSGESGG